MIRFKWKQLQEAITHARAAYETAADDHALKEIYSYQLQSLLNVEGEYFGFPQVEGGAVEEEVVEEEPKKKRESGWSQEQKDAQAERMRQRQAAKKAAREAEANGATVDEYA